MGTLAGDPWAKIQPGQAFAPYAELLNAQIDAARQHRAPAGGTGQGAGYFTEFDPNDGLVQNNAGMDLPQFAVVGLGAPLIDPGAAARLPGFQQMLSINSAAPAAARPFAVLLEPIPAGAIGKARLAGIICVQVNVTDTSHLFCGPVAGDYTKLASAATERAAILNAVSATGIQWCYVRLGDLGGTFLLDWTCAGGTPAETKGTF